MNKYGESGGKEGDSDISVHLADRPFLQSSINLKASCLSFFIFYFFFLFFSGIFPPFVANIAWNNYHVRLLRLLIVCVICWAGPVGCV